MKSPQYLKNTAGRCLELSPCRDLGGVIERADIGEQPDFWTLYRIADNGLAFAISDHATEAAALAVANRMGYRAFTGGER